MPRARARCLFELGGQWIAEEPGRVGFYRFWNDAGSGRTRRASLGTSDFEAAKSCLAEIVVRGAAKTTDSHLSIILEDYFVNRTDHLASKDPARHAGHLLLQCWGALIKTGAIDDAKQREFIDWSLAKEHSLGYVARNLGVLAAALARAKISIDIVYNETEMLAKWPLKPKAKRRTFIPTDDDLARLLAADIPENLRRWVMNAMATVGRPEAVLGLSPASRQREANLVDLNPEGRVQNKKYRPIVRVLPAQELWLDKWEAAGLKVFGGRYCGYASVDSVDTALRRARDLPEVNLPRLSVYSFRHKGTTVLRAAKVPEEQIAYQMGHRRPQERSTRAYGEYDPSYLAEAAAALDAWIARILGLAAGKSHGIPTAAKASRKKAA